MGPSLVLLSLLTLAAPTAAPTASTDASLAAAEHAYRARDYDDVLRAVRQALRHDLTLRQRVRAMELEALSYVAFDDSSHAISAFERLLHVDNTYRPSGQSSPKVMGLFDEARRRVPPPPNLLPAAALAPSPPTTVVAAAPGVPLTRRWWFWTAIGGVVVGAGVLTYVETRPHLPSTTLGQGSLH